MKLSCGRPGRRATGLLCALGWWVWLGGAPPAGVGAPGPADATPASVQVTAGEFRMGFLPTAGGVLLESLHDTRQRRELLATNNAPFFTLLLRRGTNAEELRLTADLGWGRVQLRPGRESLDIRWAEPQEPRLRGLSVKAKARGDRRENAWHWELEVANANQDWGVWRATFPELALAPPGEPGLVFFPRGPGEVQTNVWARPFSYHGNYPGGWCAMQFMAAYAAGAGLYVGLHDPWGSTKDLALDAEPANRLLRLRYNHPAPNMGRPGNGFALSGTAVWQLLRGDWFDAASVYKTWASRHARWWPALGADGRRNTPPWMRTLNAWAMSGGAPAECVTNVLEFQRFLGVPAGFHWYNWHQIPFDNDYPHYFPAKAGFADGVAALQRAPVYAMPYINGRLWDIHDRGAEDFEFSRRALPAASKRPDGQPFTESYGSKETNGQPVRLAAMCPSTPLWQQTVRDTVLKLLREAGTRAVYIDQVAAAPPTLCMDPTHGHPLGGGHWWNEGYWRMLDKLRQAMPADTMITTECNGEPFVRWFDGYLTWHWQYNGQVPAFPAVYGGAMQMFGRAYRGGATKDLALRMKAAQQLVFGEQLGWLDPSVVREPENAPFFRQIAQLRAQLNRFFAQGEMARPPRLIGNLPTVRADWQWSGEWWVTTDAVLTGAWRLAQSRELALVFVNVSDEKLNAELRLAAATYGLPERPLQAARVAADSPPVLQPAVTLPLQTAITLAPRRAEALVLKW